MFFIGIVSEEKNEKHIKDILKQNVMGKINNIHT